MLDSTAIMEKLYELPQVFQLSMSDKDYPRAKHCYDTARTVAVFLGLDEEHMNELFGEREEHGVVTRQGLFPEESVQKAYRECIRMNMTSEALRKGGGRA